MTEGSSSRTIRVGALIADPARARAAPPGAISLRGPHILAVTGLASSELSEAERGLAALPAPSDAHDHGRGLKTIAFGALDDTLEIWLSALGQEPASDPYLRAAVAFARLAEGGVAAANHCHNAQDPARLIEEAEAVARAARDVGIRIAFAVPILDRNPLVYADPAPLFADLSPADAELLRQRGRRALPPDRAIAAVAEIAAFTHATFDVQYGPVGPQWVSDGALKAIAKASADTGRRIHMHLFETRAQREWADAAYPDGLIGWLDEIGFLSPRLTVAHGVWLSEAECALLGERGVTVSINTSSNLRLRSGIAPVARLLGQGVRFGMGLDGMAFDDDEDAFREIRLLWQHHRGYGGKVVLTPERLLQAVLIDGRRSILGEDGGGRLAVGAPADIAVVDLAGMSGDILDGALTPLDLLLTRLTKAQLRELIVAGRTVVADGRCVTVDRVALEGELLEQARAGWRSKPPDLAALGRLQGALRRYYACGCHRHLQPTLAEP
jgi:cytosine/adenosine deaminase-related metal-dependent hydrolase